MGSIQFIQQLIIIWNEESIENCYVVEGRVVHTKSLASVLFF